MSSLELQRLAARMVSGPRDAGLYVRALEAAAVARRGLELLQEVAEMLDGPAGTARPVPARVHRLRPGDRLVLEPDRAGLDEPEEAATDLLDGAAEALSRTLASGSVHDLAANLARLTEPGLREQVADEVASLLESLPAGDVARLREAVARWRQAGAEPSFLTRLADAMLPAPEGERGDRLRFAGDRLRDAAALLKAGKEMLQEVASLLPGGQPRSAPSEPVAGVSGDPESFTPGSWVRAGESLVPTDPLELLGREVAVVVAPAAAGIEAVERLLAELTRGLDDGGRPVGLLQARLESASVSTDDLARLAGALGLPPAEAGERPAVERPPQKRRASLGQLGRALERAPERFRTIEAAWEVLGSEKATFARRWAAGVHLCRLTRERVRSEPAEAAAWAARVGQAAAAFPGAASPFEERMVDFLGTFASAHVGNALRVQGHLLVAERFFLPWNEDDQLGLRAEYLALKATLRRVQRRPLEAIALFEEADRIASRGGFPGAAELTARIRIAHAHALEMMGEIKEAAGLLRTTLGRASTSGGIQAMPAGELSPGLRYIALQNLADFLSKAGEFEDASQVLAEADEAGQNLDHPELDILRTQWVRARLEVRIALHAGVDTLEAVRQRLLALGLLHDAALASLELAQWHAEEIRGTDLDIEHVEAIRVLAAESAAFSAGQDVGPEAVAAIALFQHVSTFAVPTPSVLRKIERLLRQAAVV